MKRYRIALAACIGFLCFPLDFMVGGEPQKLAIAETPSDNPLKGLVPYANAQVERFPHSLEFDYLRLADVMTGPNQFDWQPLESRLDKIASRGCQAVFRVWMEYPKRMTGVPQFLIDEGVKLIQWEDTGESPPVRHFTPDYEDERLIASLETFIAEFGKRYDGDPRLGYLTAGLLGEWGEWHDWPRADLFASKKTQLRVLQAYEKGFTKTSILLRYPAGDGHEMYVATSHRPFGYHDDSFAWGTLNTGKSSDSWFYMSLLEKSGQEGLDKWKTRPIGGEIRPEVWGQVFDEKPKHRQAQDFEECVRKTHVTWLMDSGMFQKEQPATRVRRATEQVRKMGYDFHVQTGLIERSSDGAIETTLTVMNNGVAPFYSHWPLEMAALSSEGSVLKTFPVDWTLTGILPDAAPTTWTSNIPMDAIPPQTCKLGLRVKHPLANGKPLYFANAAQNADAKGWLTIGAVPGLVGE
jgi:hypothetical protein